MAIVLQLQTGAWFGRRAIGTEEIEESLPGFDGFLGELKSFLATLDPWDLALSGWPVDILREHQDLPFEALVGQAAAGTTACPCWRVRVDAAGDVTVTCEPEASWGICVPRAVASGTREGGLRAETLCDITIRETPGDCGALLTVDLAQYAREVATALPRPRTDPAGTVQG